MEIDDAIHALAARQHAAVSIDQALELGATRPMLRHRVRTNRLHLATRHVLTVPGAPPVYRQRLMVAALDGGPGAFVSCDASAASWRLAGFGHLRIRTIDVSRPRGGARRPSTVARIHEVRDLAGGHTTVLHGIPIATATRTVFELAGSVHPLRTERALDSALAHNLTSHALLVRMLDDWADHGRAGTVLMRELIEARPPDYVPPASNLEARFNTLAARHGLGRFRRQVNIGGEVWIGRVDFLSERCPLVVEVQSTEFHEALCDETADERRFAALRAAGFTPVAVWDHEIWGDGADAAMSRVRRAQRDLLRAPPA
jgi:very-short-patch-repair endonuclease